MCVVKVKYNELRKTGDSSETCAICCLPLSTAWDMIVLSRGWSWSFVCLFRLVDTPQFPYRRALVALNNILTLDVKHTKNIRIIQSDRFLVILTGDVKQSEYPTIDFVLQISEVVCYHKGT